jgi:aspartate racemase
MKTIGLIGGMSWESTLEYYRQINLAVHDKLGGYHSAKCVMVSVDFAEIEEYQRLGRWEDAAEMLAQAAHQLEIAGADLIVLCTNTMHISAPTIQSAVSIPFLHIADATAQAIRALGLARVGLLGTRFTMEEDFYTGRLIRQHGLQVCVPESQDRQIIHRIIYEELVHGIVLPESRQAYREIIGKLVSSGAQGIILGCTEIGLLVKPDDATVPLFDTTALHALGAVHFALDFQEL